MHGHILQQLLSLPHTLQKWPELSLSSVRIDPFPLPAFSLAICVKMTTLVVEHMNSTFGAMLIGSFITMVIYGITTLQMYFYYLSFPKDSYWIKLLVALIWFLDTLHVIFMCHAIHSYLITGFGNLAALASGTWSLYTSIAINVGRAISDRCPSGMTRRRCSWHLLFKAFSHTEYTSSAQRINAGGYRV